MRTGLLGRKLGMTRVLTEDGQHIPVTLVQVSGNEVVNVRTLDSNGYTAVQLGFGEQKATRLNKAQRSYFAKQKITPKRRLKEFRVSEEAMLKVGDKLSCDHFVKGQFVDVSAKSVGKGFAGVMKRHNFAGMRASHGVSIAHRAHGSTGQCQDPGKVFKGKKMAGQMGAKQVTMQSLEVVMTDLDDQIIAIKGHIPGAKNTIVEIRDAVKRPSKVELPFPAKLLEGAKVETAAVTEQPAVESEVASETPVTENKSE